MRLALMLTAANCGAHNHWPTSAPDYHHVFAAGERKRKDNREESKGKRSARHSKPPHDANIVLSGHRAALQPKRFIRREKMADLTLRIPYGLKPSLGIYRSGFRKKKLCNRSKQANPMEDHPGWTTSRSPPALLLVLDASSTSPVSIPTFFPCKHGN
jgi:hypothetical protein